MTILACGRIKDKAGNLVDEVKKVGKRVRDSTASKLQPESCFKAISIQGIVPSLKGIRELKEIDGVQNECGILYVEYFRYRAPKPLVLAAIDQITPQTVNDYQSDRKCKITTAGDLNNAISPDERTKESNFFWGFQQLRSVQVFTCIKAPFRHYVIFDSKSDTVYHRVEELRD
ncbi:MAG: hypothetical protein EOP49_10875 [Sphingobacteriales bacterium]|nr:MAG: hypothetical protein EOP49_10875 [Sphingobacteriales bacterium]